MTRAPLPDDLRRRVTAAQRLLREARTGLDAAGPFAAGFAVLRLRDAAHMLLAATTDHLGLDPGSMVRAATEGSAAGTKAEEDGRQTGGAVDGVPGSLVTRAAAIGEASGSPLPHHDALARLDTAAEAFLAAGDEPEAEDARRLVHELESFFAESVRGALGTDPSRLGRRRLVGHRRTENWLRKAEAALEEGDAAAAVRAAAAAFAVYRQHLDGGEDGAEATGSDDTGDSGDSGDDPLAALRRDLAEQRRRLDLVMNGVDLSGYRRFHRLAPAVTIGPDRTLAFADDAAPDPGADDAAFCHDFVLDTLLALRRHHPASPAAGGLTNVVLRVVREAPLLVAPAADAEEIHRVSAGQVLKTHRGGEPRNGHLQIVVDGDPAWVAADLVEEIG